MICVCVNSQNTKVRLIPPVGHTGQVMFVDVSSDNRFLLSTSLDKSIIVWDLLCGSEYVRFTDTDYAAIKSYFSKVDGNKIYSAGWDLFF